MRKLHHLVLVCWLLMGGGLFALPNAQAASPAQQLTRAIGLYDQLKFPQSFELLGRLLRRRGLSKKQRAKAYLYQGFCSFYIRTPSDARNRFFLALRLDPTLRLPKQTPPPLRRLVALEQAKLGIKTRSSRPKMQYQLRLQPVSPAYPGRPIRFKGKCFPHPKGAKLFVLIRRAKSKRFLAYPLQWKRFDCFGNVPNPYSRKVGEVEYVFQLLQGQRMLQTSPKESNPKRFQLAPQTVGGTVPGRRRPAPTPAKPSNAGAIVGVTIGVLAVIGGGVALTYFLLNQPSGPSVEVNIDIQVKGGP
jgi:hypothetical protein